MNSGLDVDKITCPKCGSEKIAIHSGMFVDRCECKDCGCEFRF